MGFFSGCTLLPRHTAGGSRDHTFIAYWPGPKNSQQLRLAVKDNIDMKGVVTTAGSEYVAKTSPPASRDAGCLAIARERNVHIVGKANLSEFAVSPSGINEYFGTPRSPFSKWWIRFIPGGSSSGSAAAITNRMADVAFGTDTTGSIRTPAACSGIVGLKTTFGLVPIKGVFPISPKHLDTVGPMAKDVSHLVQGMDLLQEGFAARYQAAVAARPSAKDIKVGRLYLGGPDLGSPVLGGTDPRIDKAVDNALAAAGFHVVKLDEAFKAKWNKAQKDANIVAASGAWISEHKYQYKPGISARTKAVILLGGILYRTEYRKALQRQAEWQRTLRRVFQKVDFIALPTLQTLPLTISPLTDTALLEARVLALQNTSAVNFAGNPALVIPIPVRHARVPVTSLQLVGPRLSEAELLNAGRLVESKH
jgi:Asp-tRNA(Asn)/Glu-tRNA(Gln) amidotransferase A subunit family amidase